MIREGAVALQKNWAYRTIKEQIAFNAVKMGIHTSVSIEMLMLSKAALWVQQQEIVLIEKLSGQINIEDL